ncbi:MAG: TauD/TfdA family dioxygenase [Gammaproteobacteria bacterium]|nr:TauD/TfdA family dioxygenase [Gammaproteobacteria bacterium]
MPIKVEPILPRFGAEVSGVDISKPLDEATRRQIIDIQHEWGVTVWRNTHLDNASHVAFSRIFGHVELAPARNGQYRFEQPELFDASNIDRSGVIVDNASIRLAAKGNRLWHSDSSFMKVRAAEALLLCHEAPPHGGPTWFADTRSAYEDLPQTMKDRLEGLQAVHSYFWSRRRAGYPYTEEEVDAMPAAVHPVVHVHKGSGRKALFIGAHTRDIIGMQREDGRKLIDELIAWCTQPQYVISVHYKPGDMSIWDNLCSLHRGGEYEDTRYRRDMRRTTVRDPDAGEASSDHYTRLFTDAGDTPFAPRDSTLERIPEKV